MEKGFKWMCLFLVVVIIFSAVLYHNAPKDYLNTVNDMVGGDDVVTDIKNYELNMTTIIYVQNSAGEWTEYQRLHGSENRIWVDLKNIPQTLIDAFISIEDQRFYEHEGVDWKRTATAFLNYLPGVNIYDSKHGGSTITQQLIKNITEDNDQSVKRKLREIARALLVENNLSKDQILEAYLNTISLGSGICGVQVASNYYFNKDVSELTLAECASLAAITKNPSKYGLNVNYENNQVRKKYVLEKMYELGKITEDEYNKAVKTKVVVDKTQQLSLETSVNNYFVDALIDEVATDLAKAKGISKDSANVLLYNGGYKIYATVDTNIQSAMETVYADTEKYFNMKSRQSDGINVQSAMTIVDYEGNIKGLVGGVGEKTINRGLNRAVDSPRQPGSTMKPLGVYALAIEKGIVSYSSVAVDEPIDNYYGRGKPGPREWYGEYEGKITVRRAIAHSANTIPVQLISKIGLEDSYSFLKNGLNFSYLEEDDINPASLAIGGCKYGITTTQSAAAYAIFGNHGVFYVPKTYTKVEDADGKTVLSRSVGNQVLKPEAADIMNKLLQGVVYDEGGTAGAIRGYSGMRAYAKTGTSSEANDSWVVGGSPYYVASVWCGFDKPENMRNTSLAAKVWRVVMSEIHKELEYKRFEMSSTVIRRDFCTFTGKLASDNCTEKESGYCVPGVKYKTCDGVHIDENQKTDDKTGTEQTPPEGGGETPPDGGGETPPEGGAETPPDDPGEPITDPIETEN